MPESDFDSCSQQWLRSREGFPVGCMGTRLQDDCVVQLICEQCTVCIRCGLVECVAWGLPHLGALSFPEPLGLPANMA